MRSKDALRVTPVPCNSSCTSSNVLSSSSTPSRAPRRKRSSVDSPAPAPASAVPEGPTAPTTPASPIATAPTAIAAAAARAGLFCVRSRTLAARCARISATASRTKVPGRFCSCSCVRWIRCATTRPRPALPTPAPIPPPLPALIPVPASSAPQSISFSRAWSCARTSAPALAPAPPGSTTLLCSSSAQSRSALNPERRGLGSRLSRNIYTYK
ncbi:hypothetical protein B484DRAFT_87748 [Ochromonadaceae sp. CCMP2298]|nr:hypothetical protein B484DRAFT_87748 [Ochromonadaceae sp. CCMP2298]